MYSKSLDIKSLSRTRITFVDVGGFQISNTDVKYDSVNNMAVRYDGTFQFMYDQV
jgi:hypothetical protein